MRKILLDTSVVIDLLRRKDKKTALISPVLKENLFISIITHTELFAGKSVWENTEASKQLKEFIINITIISLSEKISEKAGYIKTRHKNSSIADAIIAATAIENDCELVTLNVKDFKNIPQLKLLENK